MRKKKRQEMDYSRQDLLHCCPDHHLFFGKRAVLLEKGKDSHSQHHLDLEFNKNYIPVEDEED